MADEWFIVQLRFIGDRTPGACIDEGPGTLWWVGLGNQAAVSLEANLAGTAESAREPAADFERLLVNGRMMAQANPGGSSCCCVI